MAIDPRLRAFVKLDARGRVVPGTLILRRTPPKGSKGVYWQEILPTPCCTTTTTSTSSTTTTTTTI